jgi:hypothetical protein
LFGCTERSAENINTDKTAYPDKEPALKITAIDLKYPLKINEVNFESSSNIIHLNDGIISKIEQTVKSYYETECSIDNSHSYEDTYINTIRLYDSVQTIYLVLLMHYPTGLVNSKVLFYDNQKNQFSDVVFDFNLHALYDFDNGKLRATNLKTGFKITSPEIELVDFNIHGVSDYKFTRLFHNGTFNSIHTTILTINNSAIDTLNFNEKILGDWTEK